MIDVMRKFVAFALDFRPRVVDIALPTLLDANMEWADTSFWTTYSGATLSKVSPGYSGTRCIRAATTLANQGMYQDVLENGKPVRITGWCRGTAVQRILGGGAGAPAQWDFPISADWQYFDVSGTANGTRFHLVAGSAGVGYVEFDDIQVIQPRSCIPNYGQAGGAPRWMMVGDGFTTSTFPTPLAGCGATFDGGDYVNLGITDRYEWSDQFSLYAFCQMYRPDAGQSRAIISNFNATVGVFSSVNANQFQLMALYDSASTADSGQEFVSKCVDTTSYTCTWGGGTAVSASMKFYKSGILGTFAPNADSRTGSIKNGRPFLLGAGYTAGGAPTQFFMGSIFAAGISDGILLPQDIYDVDTLVKSRMR